MTARTAGGGGTRPWSCAGACALMALITALAGFLPYIIGTGGFFTLAEDYNQQQIPFLTAACAGIKALPAGEWVWNLDLGSSLITGFGFYNLGSPFTWLALPFSPGQVPYALPWLMILKYVTAAVTACLWLRRFVKQDASAALGGLLYAFSGFQTTNLLFHFHDAVAFFPLMMLGMDRLTEEKKGLFFSISVMLNCLVNYVFFVQEAVFMVIYFLFRHAKRGQAADLLKQGGKVFAFAALGVVLASPLFLPNVIYLLSSPRGGSRLDWGRMLYSVEDNLFTLKGFLLPGEAMREQSMIFRDHFLSTSVYVPFFGMSFAAIYLVENRGWLKRLLITLVLISFSPLLQAGFLLFTETFQRWWYMLNLLCVLATVLVFDRAQFQTRKGLRILGLYALGVAAFCAVIWKAPWAPGGTLVIRKDLYFLFTGIALGSCVLCLALAGMKRLNGRSAVIFAMIACAVTTGATVGVYRRAARFGDETGYDYRIGTQLEAFDEQYRYREVKNLYTAPGRGAGVSSFTSTKENAAYEFLGLFAPEKAFDVSLMNTSYLVKTVPGLTELLGGKYYLADREDGGALKGPLDYWDGARWIAEADACPIGFGTGNYITREELEKIGADQRAYVLMDAVVVDSRELVSAYHERRWDAEEAPEDPMALIRRTAERRVHSFQRDSRGFSCATDFDQDQLVFFSVPNDAGWTATVDREKVPIINACGMMALDVPKGAHEIAFSYTTPGFRPGLVLSAAGWLVWLLLEAGMAGDGGTALRGRKVNKRRMYGSR